MRPAAPILPPKASSDHLVRAWRHYLRHATIVTNCSNNYGPFHFPEADPLVILNALDGKPLPVYGRATKFDNWLYVEDHARALYKVVTTGVVGRPTTSAVITRSRIWRWYTICDLLDEMVPKAELLRDQSPMWRIAPVTIAVVPSMPVR